MVIIIATVGNNAHVSKFCTVSSFGIQLCQLLEVCPYPVLFSCKILEMHLTIS
jgi:hypothetical protein